MTKNPLKSNLAKLGLLVPLAFVASTALADGLSAEEVAQQTVASEAASEAQFDEKAEASLFVDEKTILATHKDVADALSGKQFASFVWAQKGAAAGLFAFDSGKLSSGGFTAQANQSNSSFTYKIDTGAARTLGAIVGQEKSVQNRAKSILLGVGSASSLNGSDKLVIGAFGGAGEVEFDAPTLLTLDVIKTAKDDKAAGTDDDVAEVVESRAASADKPLEKALNTFPAIDFAAKSKGFSGGLFANYAAEADSATGLFLSASTQFDRVENFIKRAKNGDIPTKLFGFRSQAIRTKASAAFGIALADVAGFPIFATPFVQGSFDLTLGLGDLNEKKDGRKSISEFGAGGGIALSTVLLDGKLQPFFSIDASKAFTTTDKFLGQSITESKLATSAAAGLSFAAFEGITLSAKASSGLNFDALGDKGKGELLSGFGFGAALSFAF